MHDLFLTQHQEKIVGRRVEVCSACFEVCVENEYLFFLFVFSIRVCNIIYTHIQHHSPPPQFFWFFFVCEWRWCFTPIFHTIKSSLNRITVILTTFLGAVLTVCLQHFVWVLQRKIVQYVMQKQKNCLYVPFHVCLDSLFRSYPSCVSKKRNACWEWDLSESGVCYCVVKHVKSFEFWVRAENSFSKSKNVSVREKILKMRVWKVETPNEHTSANIFSTNV